MGITENIDRIEQGKTSIISSIKSKGVNVPSGVLINEIAPYINEIQGGGGDVPDTPKTELEQKYEGATVIRVNIPTDNYEFAINLCNDATTATYNVDWGDNILENSLTTDEQHHTYAKAGIYDINIYNLSENITLGGKDTISDISVYSTVYFLFNNTNNDNWSFKLNETKDNSTVSDVLIGNKITTIGDYAFQYCTSLQSVIITEGVTVIGVNAFQNCTSLQSVIIPESVTVIGGNAFQYCSSLQSVIIPEGVTSVGSSGFGYCYSLQTITIPDSVTTIGDYAFQNCTSLQSVIIPEGVTSIGDYAFQDCYSLQSVIIPEGVTVIGNAIFRSCSSLQRVVIPESITKIDNYAFQDCYSLQSVVIPESVTTIRDYAFRGCFSLQSVVIPEGVNSISSYAFQNCTSLQSVVIPEGVGKINNSAFNGCYALQSITVNRMTAPTISSNIFPTSSFKYTKRYLYVPKGATGYDTGNWKTYLIDKGWELRYIEEHIKTPTTMKLKTVNNFLHKWDCIGDAKLVDYDLVDNEYIYHFDDKIEEIIRFTFYKKMLKEIEIPEGVTSIGDYAFKDCYSLQSVIIPEGVTSVGSSVFNSCYYLHSITVNAMTAPALNDDIFIDAGIYVPWETPKILRIPEGANGYANWINYSKSKGYTLEYIEIEEPIEPDYTEYTDMLFFAPAKHTTNVQVKISEDCIVDEFKYTTSPLFSTDIKSLNYDELNYPTVSKGETIEISSLSGTSILWKGALRNSSSVDTPIFEVITDKEEDNEVQVAGELNNGSFDYAYYYMLRGNTALSYIGTGLALTAEYVGRSAYQNMFFNCTNFDDGSDIHISAKVVKPYGLGAMFSGCTSLTTAPYLNVEQVDDWGMAYMFANTAITTAPELKVTKLSYNCFNNTFSGCSNLNYIKHHIIEWNASYTQSWLKDVASEGTMYCPLNSTIPSNDASGLPDGWIKVAIE